MASVNQTRPHCVNQMGRTHSKPLAARHGRGTVRARHGMCESAFKETDCETAEPAGRPQHLACCCCCGDGTKRYEILGLVITQVRRHLRRQQSVTNVKEKTLGNCLGGSLGLK